MCNFSVSGFYHGRELRLWSCPSLPGPVHLEALCQGASPGVGSKPPGGPHADGQEEERPALLDHNLLGAD